MIFRPLIWVTLAASAAAMMALGTLAAGEADTITEAEYMTTAKTDPEALARFISLENTPSSVLWDTNELPGGSDWMLTALLTYSAEERDALLAGMTPQAGTFSMTLPPWLPSDVTAALQTTGDVLQSDQTVSPDPFFQSPLLTGNAVAVGETHVFVVLQTQ